MLRPHSLKSPARANWENIALPLLFEICSDMRDCGQDLIFMTPWITLCVFTNEKLFELWDAMLSKCPKIACILVDFVIVPVLCTCPKACERSVWRTADSIRENYHSVRMDEGMHLLPKLLRPCFHFTYRGRSFFSPCPILPPHSVFNKTVVILCTFLSLIQ